MTPANRCVTETWTKTRRNTPRAFHSALSLPGSLTAPACVRPVRGCGRVE
jgi:hypothetical protein